MANICSFHMMVRGTPKDTETFFRYLTDYESSPKYFARIFSAELESDSFSGKGIRTLRISGECAWSVYSCMCDGKYTYYGDGGKKLTCLRDATKELHLEVEVRSEEPGFGFWEHFRYKDGECLCDESGDLPGEYFEMEDAA